MAFDAFIKLTGIDGETLTKGYEKAIELESVSWGASNPTNLGGTGLGAGKVSLSSLSFTKKTDKASPTLFAACCDGRHIANCTVHLRKAGGEAPVEFLLLTLGDVKVDSWQIGASSGQDVPMESVSIAFSKIEFKYLTQDGKGKAATSAVGSWDLKTGTK